MSSWRSGMASISHSIICVFSFRLTMSVVQIQRSQGRAGQGIRCAWSPGIFTVLYNSITRLSRALLYNISKEEIRYTIPTTLGYRMIDEFVYNEANRRQPISPSSFAAKPVRHSSYWGCPKSHPEYACTSFVRNDYIF